ncbi:MAG TPA: tryptophan halogenase family protein [Caulobacterales bacterium]|nr:tryptophan halogenase family protein [Caulobacterales bacterium]
MNGAIQRVVVVGGGTAGWLTASILAAKLNAHETGAPSVTLVESPDAPTIGVGEGTWPTIRETLRRIRLPESEFLTQCDASFKQGSRFDGWVSGAANDSYLHPFMPPIGGAASEIHAAWRAACPTMKFADAVCLQGEVCAHDLAPKLSSMPDYEGALNYAYHLDAGKFAALLARHAAEKLGVRHVRDHVTGVESAENGDIKALTTREIGRIDGDLFIDCTGLQSLLLGRHFGVEFIDQRHVLFNDAALAVQAPVEAEDAIASQTISTAHGAGWIWDIGLPTRRGIGLVYASAFMSDDAAHAELERYVSARTRCASLAGLSVRKIPFQSGHRAEFWRGNCLAIGLSAGFIEPLEASAIVMIELSARMLADNFPRDRALMRLVARRFNEVFAYRWGRIVDFLKLHYCLSGCAGAYWDAHRSEETRPARLSELLQLWRWQPPSPQDFPQIEEIFSAASHQYILYGMGYETAPAQSFRRDRAKELLAEFEVLAQRKRKLVAGLPTNRSLLSGLMRAGAPLER